MCGGGTGDNDLGYWEGDGDSKMGEEDERQGCN